MACLDSHNLLAIGRRPSLVRLPRRAVMDQLLPHTLNSPKFYPTEDNPVVLIGFGFAARFLNVYPNERHTG